MNAAERHTQLMDLFDEACDLDSAGRDAVIARVRDADPALAAELAAMLAYDLGALDPSGSADAALAITSEGPVGALALGIALIGAKDAVPEVLGRYRVLRPLGEGGMGIVLEAEQESPRRRVALKLLRRDLATPRMRRRFRAEAQILARLAHPGIARVYEAVVDAERPYLVMELVDGRSLSAWCDTRKPDLRTKVEVLAKVLDAVDHAHRNGVIHRDLKPPNILVDAHDEPKVLDFGIARVSELAAEPASDDERTPARGATPATPITVASADTHTMTRAGEIVGTPAYMSPEQTRLDPKVVDHRTDVYALGVVAYELLTGAMPYMIDRGDLVDAFTTIRDTTPVPAGRRVRALRGDLEVILGKALEKAPERRYASAAAFADDLRRWLRSEPVLARPPSALYQLSRFVKRQRALALAIAALVVVLIAGAAVTTWLYLEERAAQAELRQHVDELVLARARSLVVSDPSEAVKSLDDLSAAAPWERAWLVAWEARARGVARTIYDEHRAEVEWVDVDPRGERIASASFDGTVIIRERATGHSVRIAGDRTGFNRAVFSPDGSHLAAAGREGSVIDVTWASGSAVDRRIAAHAGECEDVAWSPDGSRLASVGADGALMVVDLDTTRAHSLVADKGAMKDVAWAGDRVIAASSDGSVYVWDAVADRVEARPGHTTVVDQVAFADPRGARWASGDGAGGLRIWDADGRELAFQSASGAGVKGLVFLDSQRLAVVDRAGALAIWDLARGTARTVTDTGGVFRGLAETADRAWLAAASDDRTVTLWDTRTFTPFVLRGHRDAVQHVVFTPDGQDVVSSANDGQIRVWPVPHVGTRVALPGRPHAAVPTAATGDGLVVVDREGRVIRADGGRVQVVAEGQDALLIAAGSRGNTIVSATRDGVVSARSGASERRVDVAAKPIAVAVSADDNGWAVATNEGRIRVVGPFEGELTTTGERAATLVFVSPSAIVTGHRDGRVRLTRLPRQSVGDPIGPTLAGEVRRLVARGELVLAGSIGGDVHRWRVTPSGVEDRGGYRHDAEVLALALAPDGRAASGGRDALVRVDGVDGDLVLRGHTGAVTALVFIAGRWVSGSDDRTVRVWDAARGDATVIDLFDAPIVAIVPGPTLPEFGATVAVLADDNTVVWWPVGVPHDEGSVRRFLAGLFDQRNSRPEP